MRGRALLLQLPTTKDNNNAARDRFGQALKINPNDADALAGEAYTYLLEFRYKWTDHADHETDYNAKILGQVDRMAEPAKVTPANGLPAFLHREAC
jgi:adenylate cyclase